MSHKLDYIKRFVKRCLLLGCYLVIGNTKGTRKKKNNEVIEKDQFPFPIPFSSNHLTTNRC